ncbi:MAG: hypothetical protein K0S76_727 [Herbinix sp.]|nr:hypothetical protein [Herbinix sp.]
MNLKIPTPEESFRKWTSNMEWRIEVLMEKGFTKDQAIELLKVYMLGDLENIFDAVNSIG